MNYMKLLSMFGVSQTNLRIIDDGKPVINEVFETDVIGSHDVETWLKEIDRTNSTIFATFNQPSIEKVIDKTFNDSIMKKRCFILVDLDPVRPTKVSATDKEKNEAFKKMEEVRDFLLSNGIKNIIECDSGNGYHMLIPINPVDAKESTNTVRGILSALSKQFTTEKVAIDQSVFNSSQLTKFYGCIAKKGEDTNNRPHRRSRILSQAITNETNDLALISKLFKTEIKTVSHKANPFVKANAKAWLDYYHIDYDSKAGDTEGMTLFILKQCPLKTHTNSQRGATLQQTSDFKVRFSCLHESHSDMSINNFKKKYPIPGSARIKSNIQCFLEEEKPYTIEAFTLKNDGLFKNTKDGVIKVSPPIYISKHRRMLETYEAQILLNYKCGDDWLSRWFGIEVLMLNEFRKLVKNSVPIPPRFEADMIDYLLKQKNELPVDLFHSQIGWSDGTFLLDQSYGSLSKSNSYLSTNSPFKLEPKGQYTNFEKMLKDEVLGTEMELALAIGFSSIVVGKLSTLYPDVTTLMISIEGESTTGKSTAQLLMTALFGDPNSLFDSWNGTQNSIVSKVQDNNGIAYALDELGSTNNADLTNLIYQLSTGKSRMRLDQQAKLKKQHFFSTTIISSSEFPLKNKVIGYQGIDARVLSFRGVQWTKTALSSEKIKKVSYDNYGTPAPLFIEKLFEYSDVNVEMANLYETCKEELDEFFKNHHLKGRMVAQYAIILTSAYLVKRLLGFNLDIDSIKLYLDESYDLAIGNNKNSDELTYDEVLAQIFLEHQSNLISENQAPIGSFVGRVKKNKGRLLINISKNFFERSLASYLPNIDISSEIKKMISQEKLRHEKHRNTKRIKVSGTSFTTYEFELDSQIAGFRSLQYQSADKLLENSQFVEQDNEKTIDIDEEDFF